MNSTEGVPTLTSEEISVTKTAQIFRADGETRMADALTRLSKKQALFLCLALAELDKSMDAFLTTKTTHHQHNILVSTTYNRKKLDRLVELVEGLADIPENSYDEDGLSNAAKTAKNLALEVANL